jgi:TRAP transporter TAXI family solute receptor
LPWLARLLALLLLALAPAAARAQSSPAPDFRYFRIATGTASGTYFPIGTVLANALSNPPGTRPCERGGSCGVPGLIAVVQATSGALENLELLRTGVVEAALAQSNLAYAAYHGLGLYQGRPAFVELRAVATLYIETVHLVVRDDSPIRSWTDLRGKAVSVGEAGSSTMADARTILGGLGLGGLDRAGFGYRPMHFKPGNSMDRLLAGEIDAAFLVGGAPFAAITDAAGRAPIRLLPLTAEDLRPLNQVQPFFTPAAIAANTYPGVPETATAGVRALLLVRAELEEELVQNLTRALWHPATGKLLAEGHPIGQTITAGEALDGLSVPLHPGAARQYRAAGLLPAEGPPAADLGREGHSLPAGAAAARPAPTELPLLIPHSQ